MKGVTPIIKSGKFIVESELLQNILEIQVPLLSNLNQKHWLSIHYNDNYKADEELEQFYNMIEGMEAAVN